MERLVQMLEAFDSKLDALDKRFDALDKRFDALDKCLDALDKKVDALSLRRHRTKSSTRGLNKREALLHLQTQGPPPSLCFTAWIQQGLQRFTLDHLGKGGDKFEDIVFSFLESSYEEGVSPIFSVKREKTNYIFEDGAFRVMQENDMKRLILLFQNRAIILLDLWKRDVDQQWERWATTDDAQSDSSGENTDDNTARHFQERRYMLDADKINRLCFDSSGSNLLRTLLRKFNTYMLRARGITFVHR